jgi:predicted metal-dependent phosphoesterase TrpH
MGKHAPNRAMIIDLHVHTKPRSPCSHIEPEELLAEATRLGLDGVCLTEHHVLWQRAELEELADNAGITLFTGNEITTDQGDVIVFQYPEPVPGVIPLAELHRDVAAAGGFIVAAHPLRGFKTFGVGKLKLTAAQAARRKVFQFVDAVEVRNGRLNEEENAMAAEVAAHLGLVGLAGSDAHRPDEIGRWVTVLERTVMTEQELIAELRAGRFTIDTVR